MLINAPYALSYILLRPSAFICLSSIYVSMCCGGWILLLDNPKWTLYFLPILIDLMEIKN